MCVSAAFAAKTVPFLGEFKRLDDEEEGEEDENTYHTALPSFGTTSTPHADVAAFYREWRLAIVGRAPREQSALLPPPC